MIIFLSLLFSGTSFLSAQAFKGYGDKKVQVGFIPYGYGNGLGGALDYGLTNVFSAGAGAEFYFGEGSNNFYLFGRGDLHLTELLSMPSQMDLYPGIDLGLAGGKIGLGGHLGFRYFFTNNIGAYIEFGSRGSLGVSINL
ncbi:hypothetical protein KRX57_01735 [Weeksellaceae bacterium TAE3-ERU29]|nr:hypothetical protein [Weeksellaceae bacterium TAE3-ERU29]